MITYFLFCTISDILWIISPVLAVDRGGERAPLFNALVGGEHLPFGSKVWRWGHVTVVRRLSSTECNLKIYFSAIRDLLLEITEKEWVKKS